MKKIIKKKATNLTLALLCALTLSGCGTEYIIEETANPELAHELGLDTNETEYYELPMEDETLEEALEMVAENTDSALEEDKIDYSVHDSYISIDKKSYSEHAVLSDEDYGIINEGLSNPDVYTLMVDGINDEIDFSKLNLENIKWLFLENLGPKFPYEKLYNKTYMYINIKQRNADEWDINAISEFFNNIELNEATVNLRFLSPEIEIPEQRIIDVLSNKTGLDTFILYDADFSNLDISNLIASWIIISNDGTDKDINVNATINDAVDNFTISYYYPESSLVPEIKSIKINSKNDSLITNVYILSKNDTVIGRIDEDILLDMPKGIIDIQGVDIKDLSVETLQLFEGFKAVYISEGGLDPARTFIYKEKDGIPFEDVVKEFGDKKRIKPKSLVK